MIDDRNLIARNYTKNEGEYKEGIVVVVSDFRGHVKCEWKTDFDCFRSVNEDYLESIWLERGKSNGEWKLFGSWEIFKVRGLERCLTTAIKNINSYLYGEWIIQ